MTKSNKIKNELISVNLDGDGVTLVTTNGNLKIGREDAEAIKSGIFPTGVKKSPIIDGISLRGIKRDITSATRPKLAQNRKKGNTEIEIEGVPMVIRKTENKEGQETIDLHELGKELKKKFHFVVLKDRKNRTIDMFYYDQGSGIYRSDAKDRLNHLTEQIFTNGATTNLKNELYAHVRDQGFTYVDNWLSQGPAHIVVNNGTVNLEKYLRGEPPLETWSHEYHSLNRIDADFVDGQESNLFSGHLLKVIPDESDRDRFHKFVGSFLDSKSYAHQKILILLGNEGSGKTVTLRIFSKFFGSENISAKSFQQLAEDKFAMAELFGVLANLCEELPQSAVRSIERLNSLTGGLVDAQKKNQNPFVFYQNAKIAVACNDLPELDGEKTTIRAFMSRVLIIVFNRIIRGTEEEIQNYDDVILTQKSGILNWVLEGYRKYMEAGRKISSSRSTDETLEFYIANSDFVSYFLKGCTAKGGPNDYVIKEELWQAYLKASRTMNTKTVSRQTFLVNVLVKNPYGNVTSERISIKTEQDKNPAQRHVFKGIKLKDESEWFKNENTEQEDDGHKQNEEKGGNLGNKNDNLPSLPTGEPHAAKFEEDENRENKENKKDREHEEEHGGSKGGNLGNLGNDLPHLPTSEKSVDKKSDGSESAENKEKSTSANTNQDSDDEQKKAIEILESEFNKLSAMKIPINKELTKIVDGIIYLYVQADDSHNEIQLKDMLKELKYWFRNFSKDFGYLFTKVVPGGEEHE